MEKIGIMDPPGVDKGDDVPKRKLGKFEKNLDERLKLVTASSMYSSKDKGTELTSYLLRERRG